ncbi:PD-(D/E)XK nuclease-like domain-containing protein [Enterobacter hormaechei subsp. steigerwaltii]|uniref:RecE family exodeoxyribonuclease n=1 Tax=Enterobacter hormaechei TaxID=158836 RepID=UPI00330A19DD|nr:PD-(D/E)XK nuclease-like domain-containing protein [Enterobacter hormaechei subsp. steigerwaltii]MCU3214867.1 PD-(D/E)XK nuclease-like domain-containing protein [Enterobacter hormaechei subsp. steigerwaltii]MCU3370758.1 PD-(D/E)XK nuclease-like domain-containing protein [Enterobacter hormaechei subsp. steigerwaltii]MCU3687979.1 PD-(D/E)XK nuclease-like domain-containing protein [Enterobacter hormaechei subsp. steigerwaltii]HDF7714226.1 PD-(D/E)XK nuclease-like domain-containing protein [Ente
MEFFYVVKATQKSGKEDAVIWFTAKSEARANLQLDVELEDAGIETGRGKDYVKPVRTDFPVYNDLPEESTVDYTWCKRYTLQDDGRTWLPKAGAEPTGPVDNFAAPETTVKVETTVESVPLENRTPAVRFAVHLTSNKYQSHITKEQQLAASEMSLDEGNTYLQNLLLAKNDIPEVAELSLNAEWKLVQAIKQVFAPNETQEAEIIAAFMADWVRADASDRNQLVEEWRSGKLNLLKSESTSIEDVAIAQDLKPDNGIQIDENDDETTRYPVVRMPFRKQLLAQFTGEELRHHLTREEYEGISALEMDTDNSYVQNLVLAAENCEEVKGYDTKDLWRYTDAIRKVFSQEKRHELALVLRFTRIWAATDYIDRGPLVREWADGNRISEVGSPAPLEPAKPETTKSYKRAVAQNMANLSIEIAIAQLYPDAVPGQINRTQLLAAKELADKKDESHAKALKVLGKTTDILDYDANSIFGVTRAISWSGEESITELRSQVREWFTANGIYESGERSKGYPEWSEDSRKVRHSTVEEQITSRQPQVASFGGGVVSIDGLIGGNTDPVINTSSNEVEKTENTAETTSDVQMETAKSKKDEDVDSVPPGKSTDADNSQTDSIAPEERQAEPVIEYPAYFEPGRYEGLPNDVYHAAKCISSTQVKDARVSLMYFNARHVAKTIPRTASKVLDMGNLVHALALQPENLEAEFSVEPEIPEGAFTTTATLREFIDAYNASLPALLSADEIKALLEEHNASLSAQVPLGASLEETAQSYMALPAEYQRIEQGQKQTATAMKACIKEYNATLPVPVKTSGSRDALLEQLAIINPDLVAQEAQKPTPLKVSGSKADMIQAVKSVMPDAIFADELLDAWRDNPGEKILVTRQQLATARAIQSALLAHPTAGMLLTHPSRAVEVSYFGFDDETGLEVRVRPDLEIELDGVRIGADLKTISMWNVKQESLRARLHREIIDRDYHLSAAMYCETAALDQFFWIFVNKDENYHWIAIIEASTELLELGMLEYRKTMRAIAYGFDTGEWPAPITTDYTDELNDFELRRLEALRAQA